MKGWDGIFANGEETAQWRSRLLPDSEPTIPLRERLRYVTLRCEDHQPRARGRRKEPRRETRAQGPQSCLNL